MIEEGAEAREPAPLAFRLALAAAAAVVLALALEGLASAALAWKDAREEPVIREMLHSRHDPDLGWSHRPSVHVADLYGPGRSLTTNARGLRATEEYAREVPGGRYRVICVGDSFTLGYGVDDAGTYEAELERQEPRLQAVNMGQGGYGADQAYLWYRRDGGALEHDLVLFAFIAPDFDRMLTDRFQGAIGKPVLALEDGALVVRNVPVPEGGSARRGSLGAALRRLALYELAERLRRPNRAREAASRAGGPLPYRATAEAMLAELAALCASRGSRLALVQLPLRDRFAGRPAEVSAWIAGVAAELDAPFLDLTTAFDALPAAEAELYYLPDGHLNALGNRLVASRMLDWLREKVPGFPRDR